LIFQYVLIYCTSFVALVHEPRRTSKNDDFLLTRIFFLRSDRDSAGGICPGESPSTSRQCRMGPSEPTHQGVNS
jgi:hypothetical protein